MISQTDGSANRLFPDGSGVSARTATTSGRARRAASKAWLTCEASNHWYAGVGLDADTTFSGAVGRPGSEDHVTQNAVAWRVAFRPTLGGVHPVTDTNGAAFNVDASFVSAFGLPCSIGSMPLRTWKTVCLIRFPW